MQPGAPNSNAGAQHQPRGARASPRRGGPCVVLTKTRSMITTQIQSDLDARVAISYIALCACIRDPNLSMDQALKAASEEGIDAELYAESTGRGSIHNGEHMPALYKGTSLAQCWRSGRKDEILFQEVMHCPQCNDDQGRPCTAHDLL